MLIRKPCFNTDSESPNQYGIPCMYLILFQYYQLNFTAAVFSVNRVMYRQRLFNTVSKLK